ncbi:hypothetical protein [Arsenophonus sp.]|uniref:hypothetical protein n=1 Tax=Arsenophonus sp. TaxID=1872640 RepID=UPI00285D454A|nr:hypothetical protein [Arsenophonus sp.]MDR5615940.1 hypothetical protein [Arsenophonus sp.]
MINQSNNPNITQQLTTPDSNKVKPYVARANGGGLGTSVNINLKPNYQINGKQRWFGEIDPVFTQFVQLEKTAYTLASWWLVVFLLVTISILKVIN